MYDDYPGNYYNGQLQVYPHGKLQQTMHAAASTGGTGLTGLTTMQNTTVFPLASSSNPNAINSNAANGLASHMKSLLDTNSSLYYPPKTQGHVGAAFYDSSHPFTYPFNPTAYLPQAETMAEITGSITSGWNSATSSVATTATSAYNWSSSQAQALTTQFTNSMNQFGSAFTSALSGITFDPTSGTITLGNGLKLRYFNTLFQMIDATGNTLRQVIVDSHDKIMGCINTIVSAYQTASDTVSTTQVSFHLDLIFPWPRRDGMVFANTCFVSHC